MGTPASPGHPDIVQDGSRERKLSQLAVGLAYNDEFIADEVDYVLGRFPPDGIDAYADQSNRDLYERRGRGTYRGWSWRHASNCSPTSWVRTGTGRRARGCSIGTMSRSSSPRGIRLFIWDHRMHRLRIEVRDPNGVLLALADSRPFRGLG